MDFAALSIAPLVFFGSIQDPQKELAADKYSIIILRKYTRNNRKTSNK
jgi:hypothetical protein